MTANELINEMEAAAFKIADDRYLGNPVADAITLAESVLSENEFHWELPSRESVAEWLSRSDRMFVPQYQAVFEPREHERYFFSLVREYHVQAEAFDRTVCSGSKDGVAIPVGGVEHYAVNRNAIRLRGKLFERAADDLGLTAAQVAGHWQHAMRHYRDREPICHIPKFAVFSNAVF